MTDVYLTNGGVSVEPSPKSFLGWCTYIQRRAELKEAIVQVQLVVRRELAKPQYPCLGASSS